MTLAGAAKFRRFSAARLPARAKIDRICAHCNMSGGCMGLPVFRNTAAALALFVCASTVGAAVTDTAKDYPTHPIRMLVPNAPGSAVDTLGRILAQALTQVSG